MLNIRTFKNKVQQLNHQEQGFTLIEMIVATAIIVAVVAGFTVFLAEVASTQRTLVLNKAADRVLASQVEVTEGISWDNLMVAPSSGAGICQLNDNRISTESIQAGPQTYINDTVKVSITRTVTWGNTGSGTPGPVVQCAAGVSDRADIKQVKITATWYNGPTLETRSQIVLRSRWAEAGT